ncbi:MAG: hypothetical protein AB1726_08715 [Planctomycetota bacterium]
MFPPLLVSLVAGLASPAAPAIPSVGREPLAEVARFAEVVCVGRVEEVVELEQEPRDGGSRSVPPDLGTIRRIPIARVRVERSLKGTEEGEFVYYLAMPTWTCDISRAEVGERALFLLADTPWDRALQPATRAALKRLTGSRPVYAVAHSGRGRLPLREVDGREYATYWKELLLPDDLPTIAGPEARYSFIRSALLPALEERLAQIHLVQLPSFDLSHRQPLAPRLGWRFRVWGDGVTRLDVEDPAGARRIDAHVPPERIAELATRLARTAAPELTGSFGQEGPDGPRRTFDARSADRRVQFEIHALAPELVVGQEARRRAAAALELWADLRCLFEHPGTLDARDRDRACLEAW